MALPTILVNSATGSDTAASGAGPATALSGASGVTSADGLTVSLLTDNPDLSGVATDGSAVIFMSDTNAGSRNFGKITAVDNTAGVKTVTVSDAFQALNTDAWAIGGKRASIGGTTSFKLVSNNSGAGDAMPGWIIEMQSGHTETIAALYIMRRAGDATNGRIVLRGETGAATLPILTFSNNGTCIRPNGNYQTVANFELRNSNATKTSSIGVDVGAAPTAGAIVDGIKISNSTDKFWKGIVGSTQANIINCEVGYTAGIGIDLATHVGTRVYNCFIHDCGSHGIVTGDSGIHIIEGNIIYNCTGDGINATPTTAIVRTHTIVGNTIDSCDSDGIEITTASTQILGWSIANNQLTNNGGYGINYSAGGATAAYLNASNPFIAGNNFYNNTSGKYNPSGMTISINEQTLDPQYVNAAAGDFTIGNASLLAKGYPVGGTDYIGKGSTTYSYVDPGASQRKMDYPSENDVQDGVTFDSGAKTGNLELPTEAQVESGVGFGANGTEFTGSAAGGSGGVVILRR